MQEAADCETRLCLALNADANEARDVILELQSGAETEAATEFTDTLEQMLRRACERCGWNWKPLQQQRAASGSLRRIVVKIAGTNVYRHLKHEAGAHRGMWVPMFYPDRAAVAVTANVVVMPLAGAEECPLRDEDIHEDTYFTLWGPGSHGRERFPNAIRLWHKPDSTVVVFEAEDDKYTLAQLRAQAEMLLRTQLLYKPPKITDNRPIRTYDWPKKSVKDRRVHVVAALNDVMSGHLQPYWDALTAVEEAEALRSCIVSRTA